MKEIRLDNVIRQIGKRTDGTIRFGQKADGSHYEIPVIVIEGQKAGTTLLLDGATHGDEYEGPEAILRIAKEYQDGNFAGRLVLVPALNMEAFVNFSRASLSDGFNLNRIFPGNMHSYISHRLAAVYTERILKNVDALISFHGGGQVLHLEPLCGYMPDGKKGDVSKAMAEAFNCKYLWRVTNLPFVGMTSHTCDDLGIPSILPEVGSHCGRLHNRERDINICHQGIKNVMIYFNMIDDKAPQRVEQTIMELHYLHCYNGGIQTPVKQPNEIVKPGDVLCVMQDVFGNQIEELKAPWHGVVIGGWSVPVIRPGDWWSLFGKFVED